MSNNEKQPNKEEVTSTNSVKSAKQSKQPKQTAKAKPVKKHKRKLVKEVSSELKKVSWPSFPKVVKQTGVVITVVLVFTLVLLGFDTVFSFLYRLLESFISQ